MLVFLLPVSPLHHHHRHNRHRCGVVEHGSPEIPESNFSKFLNRTHHRVQIARNGEYRGPAYLHGVGWGVAKSSGTFSNVRRANACLRWRVRKKLSRLERVRRSEALAPKA